MNGVHPGHMTCWMYIIHSHKMKLQGIYTHISHDYKSHDFIY